MERLSGKVAIITGGARGMGESHARKFIAEGAKVVITDLNDELGQALAQELGENARNAVAKRLGQKIYTPCIDESYDVEGEYMAGLGIAEGEAERGAGIANANRYAIADITSRYIGMIKNGVSQYAKNVNTRSGQKVKWSVVVEGLSGSS